MDQLTLPDVIRLQGLQTWPVWPQITLELTANNPNVWNIYLYTWNTFTYLSPLVEIMQLQRFQALICLRPQSTLKLTSKSWVDCIPSEEATYVPVLSFEETFTSWDVFLRFSDFRLIWHWISMKNNRSFTQLYLYIKFKQLQCWTFGTTSFLSLPYWLT